MDKPSISFRVYPGKARKHYYTVYIFDTREQMHEFWRVKGAQTGGKRYRDFEAIAHSYRNLMNPRDIGFVLFHKRKLGAGIVAHEFDHVAFHWLLHRGKRAKFGEEKHCWVLGELVRQFWVGHRRATGINLKRQAAQFDKDFPNYYAARSQMEFE